MVGVNLLLGLGAILTSYVLYEATAEAQDLGGPGLIQRVRRIAGDGPFPVHLEVVRNPVVLGLYEGAIPLEVPVGGVPGGLAAEVLIKIFLLTVKPIKKPPLNRILRKLPYNLQNYIFTIQICNPFLLQKVQNSILSQKVELFVLRTGLFPSF